jgi:hypothetical protein
LPGWGRKKKKSGGEIKTKTTNPVITRVSTSSQSEPLLKEIESHWQEVLDGVRPLNHSVEALLKASRPSQIDGDVLILEVFYEFHKERLESDKCRTIVEEVASEVVNRPLKIKCILGQKGKALASEKKEADVVQVAEEIFGTRAD